MAEKQLTAFAVRFRRTKPTISKNWIDRGLAKPPMEKGLFVGRYETDPDGVIIDMNGQTVPAPIWAFFPWPSEGCLILKDATNG